MSIRSLSPLMLVAVLSFACTKSPTAPTQAGQQDVGGTTVVTQTPGTTAIAFVATSNTCLCWGNTINLTAGTGSGSVSCKDKSSFKFNATPGNYAIRACGSQGCQSSSAAVDKNITVTFRLLCVSVPGNIISPVLVGE